MTQIPDPQPFTKEEGDVDDIENVLREYYGPADVWDYGVDFQGMAEGVVAYTEIPAEKTSAIKAMIEEGFYQTNDVDGPGFHHMAQMVYDAFLKYVRTFTVYQDPAECDAAVRRANAA
jgi:hypothetical protein